MKDSISFDPQLAITRWADSFGEVSIPARESNLYAPSIRLIRHDDAWRPLATRVTDVKGNGTDTIHAMWREKYGGENAYGKPPDVQFPNYWPAAFDSSPYSSDIHHVEPMWFSGEVSTRPIATPLAQGIEFTITIQDLREPSGQYPQRIIRLPVGIEMPLTPETRVYGTVEMFNDCRQIEHEVRDPALPKSWYYLEAELFGLRQEPLTAVETLQPGRPNDRIHSGAPLAIFSPDSKLWWGIASEADYGAATLWDAQRMRHFAALYLKPGGSAQWKFILWRQETRRPSQLHLTASRADGFFNALNPLGFEPKGAPEGPILFANVSRIPFQMEELRKLRPGMVLLNFHYDHISSTANLYGNWRTYEGFSYSESMLRKLIADLKQLGCRVGFYGTHATQPESHKLVRPDDYLLDAWGRRIHDWEPGNWIADPGHTDAAERYARGEAEFAQSYGLDSVFIDRLDFMAVNHNPRRVGGSDRLELVPSLRLGMIELNKKRMEWQRRLNPHLYVALNNTTQWIGIRHSDFCLLEGGDDLKDQALQFLHQPAGIVHLRHINPLFGEFKGLELFQVIGDVSNLPTFTHTLRHFIQLSLVSGVIAEPYGDEFFVDRKSMFYQEGRDKEMPDEDKNKILRSIRYHGGAEWRQYWDAVKPALDAARLLATPVASAANRPDSGPFAFPHRFAARAGDRGGIYVGLYNESEKIQVVAFEVYEKHFEGELQPKTTRAWWHNPQNSQTETLAF